MLWIITASCVIYFFTSATALRCILENSIIKKAAIENCSSSVTDCFWFKCNSLDKETNEKGCNDNLGNLWNCQVLSEACLLTGGKAYCDTCVKDLCNNAMATSFASLTIITILSILLILNIAV
ncbi:hypothetical protein LOAG_17691 [Loa loa]|uniref:Uncharacterized protein n=1 Tax=Loa loa TaxID=7209 RepID=A0A1S0UJQ4_LOALO|nr:hypothetical protein LOAG_17691 [Loa loa]EJD75097.1 hypothetical protein LOAG_17691 [Loa loa]